MSEHLIIIFNERALDHGRQRDHLELRAEPRPIALAHAGAASRLCVILRGVRSETSPKWPGSP